MLALFFLLLIFIFPQRVYADVDYIEVFYHKIDEDDEAFLVSYIIQVPSYLSVENRAMVVFSNIFDNTYVDEIIFVPKDVHIIDVFFSEEYAHLVINLSAEMLNYGGTYFEYRLVEKLIANAAALEEVAYFTILTEGQSLHLPEGTLIFETKVH